MQKKKTNKPTQSSKNSKVQNRGLRSRDKKAVSNDPGWYSVDPVLLNDAASIPFGHPAGVGIDTRSFGFGGSGSGRIPGIMAFKVAHVIGDTRSSSDPVNMAAMQSYTFIRHANSGSANYEAGDLMLYYLAMAEIYSYIEYLKRAYGVARVYSQRNRYLPDTLLAAMGVNPKTIMSDLSAMRYGLNMIINKAASFAVPNTMSLFARRAFLYQGVYTEGSSIKDQLYMYVPGGFYEYEWEQGKLVYNPLYNKPQMGIMEHLERLNVMVDKVIANEDMGIMNGDIIKAYGDNIIKLTHLEAEYTVAPAYDPLVLEQMQNATLVGPDLLDPSTLEIASVYSSKEGVDGISIVKQTLALDANDLLGISTSDLMVDYSACEKYCSLTNMSGEQIVTTMLPEPTPSDVIEITRMMASIYEADTPEGMRLCTGTEICIGVDIWTKPISLTTYVRDLTPNLESGWARSSSVAISTKATDVLNRIQNFAGDAADVWAESNMYSICNIANRANFRFAPTLYVYAFEEVASNLYPFDDLKDLADNIGNTPAARFIGSISNYTSIDESELYKLHSCAIMNEFATPHLAIK